MENKSSFLENTVETVTYCIAANRLKRFQRYILPICEGYISVTEHMRRCPINIDSLFDTLSHAFHCLLCNGLFATANDENIVALRMEILPQCGRHGNRTDCGICLGRVNVRQITLECYPTYHMDEIVLEINVLPLQA